MKKFFRVIHLYLSLVSGLVIAVVCFTGATLVFEKELVQSIYPERYKVEVGNQRVALEQLTATLKQAKPEAKISGVKIYSDPARTVEVNYSEDKGKEGEGKKSEAKKGKGSPNKKIAGAPGAGGKGEKGGPGKGGKDGGRGNVAFLNPYTGQLIATSAQKNAFFSTMFGLHRWLLVQDGPGKLIVGVSTVMFLFILLTGIILWLPKNINMLKQRLTIKWNAGWKRINHDWHIVIGFYTAIFLFVFAFTGLAWSFEWFNDGIYTLTNSDKKQPEPPLSTITAGASQVSFDKVYQVASARIPAAQFYNINKPKEDSASFVIQVMPKDAAHERATSQIFVDQYSGVALGQIDFADKNLGQRVRGTFYPVHVGSIGGMPGRIIAFLSCVAGFTFPFTGLILWLNRLKKNRAKKTKKLQKQVV